MVVTVPDNVSADAVNDSFIQWVEDNGWLCGGGVRELDQNETSNEINY